MNRVVIKTQDKNERIKNFDEVSVTLSKEDAIKEANRCLNCPNPNCMKGCPVNIRIPEFIQAIKNGDLELANKIIRDANNLPEICGRVCPQESQCEKYCIQGFKGESVAIGALERYVADNAKNKELININKNGKKVAIIGSGPSGLSCAYELIKNGFTVTVYESLHKAGGVLTYGIPSFRLPKKLVHNIIDDLETNGVKFVYNAIVGKNILISELQKEYDAIFIGTGAGLPKFMNIKNETANGVFSANEVLTRINLMSDKTPLYDASNACVIGGGNVAMDAARSLRRMGMNVTIVYRRNEESLPARKEEYVHALEEGIKFDFLTLPKEVLIDDDNNVLGLKVIKTKIDDDKVVELLGTEYNLGCDMVVMALGTTPAKLINSEELLNVSDKGLIITDDYLTNINNVYAGGDAITGSATVIKAMEAGKKAAIKIIESLS